MKNAKAYQNTLDNKKVEHEKQINGAAVMISSYGTFSPLGNLSPQGLKSFASHQRSHYVALWYIKEK